MQLHCSKVWCTFGDLREGVEEDEYPQPYPREVQPPPHQQRPHPSALSPQSFYPLILQKYLILLIKHWRFAAAARVGRPFKSP